ncbi:MAG: hypothetical protein IPP72_14735 [Chitinophagaceae bacterium]|nr:hypothetical protein [Chitinophagaceae bacterium]
MSICISSFCQFDPLIKAILASDTFNTDHTREKYSFIHYDTLWLTG